MAAEVVRITAAFLANCLHLFPFPPPSPPPPPPTPPPPAPPPPSSPAWPIPPRWQEAAPRLLLLSSQDYCPHAAAP